MEPLFSTQLICKALELPPEGGRESGFCEISTDSRTIRPGSLFVPIVGESFNGHDFIQSAVQHGASGFLFQEDRPEFQELKVQRFQVKDTLSAYRSIAKEWRQKFNFPIVAVAGSVGKSTTKEMISAILSGKWSSVLKTEKSQNGFLGIPMTLLKLRKDHQVAVIEIGIDEMNAMAAHLQIVQPTIGILTALGHEHLEKLGNIQNVVKEESELLFYLSKNNGISIMNLDDPMISDLFSKIQTQKKLGFSISGSNPQSAQDSILQAKITSKNPYSIQVQSSGFTTPIQSPLPGEHNARNLLGAISVALQLQLTPSEIENGLKKFSSLDGRSEVKSVQLSQNGLSTYFLCDYYNASPSSVRAALKTLDELSSEKSNSRKIVCLGDMLELGEHEQELHESLSKVLLQHQIEVIYLYGPRMKYLKDQLVRDGFKGELSHFSKHDEMSSALKSQDLSNSFILVKGSRGMTMEKILPPLMNHQMKK